MLRRALLGLHLQQQQQHTLQQLESFGVAALHSGSLLQQSSAASGQQEQAAHQSGLQQQHEQLQSYHAAVVAERWDHDLQQPQQKAVGLQLQHQPQLQRHPQQLWHTDLQPSSADQANGKTASGQQRLQQSHQHTMTAGTSDSGSTSSSSRSSRSNSSMCIISSNSSSSGSPQPKLTSPQAAGGIKAASHAAPLAEGQPSPYDACDLFVLSTPEEQYQRTLAALLVGHSKNLDQLAHMFDPQAVLSNPDRGAAVLEALMFAAAKLEDLQLLRQLLRCTAAAGNLLGPTGHRAVLQCLARCGRSVEALEWLQARIPEQQLSPQLLRSLVQPLLRHRKLQAAQQALDYAEPKLQQRWQQELQQLSGAAAEGCSAAVPGQEVQAAPLTVQDMQELPCLRLALAGARGLLGAVRKAWTTAQQQATAMQEMQQPLLDSSTGAGLLLQQQGGQQQLLGPKVWASYVLALSKAAKRSQEPKDQYGALASLQEAVLQLLDTYHTSLWDNYIQRKSAGQQLQLQHDEGSEDDVAMPVLGTGSGAAAPGQQEQLQWLAARQRSAQQLWQHHMHGKGRLCWQGINPALITPQQVASAARFQERDLTVQALGAALQTAAGQRSERQVQKLLMLSSMSKIMPRALVFDSLLYLKFKQGAPPEALEELLGEMMGWGVIPTVTAYEHVMEAHAQYRDLDAAEGVLDRMQAAGLQPVLCTYNRLLHGVALQGNLSVAIRVFNRLKLQGLQPDIHTMRAVFKCVRMYANIVRVTTARTISQAKAGDRDAIIHLLSQRAALFASAYSQLALWQREMVAAGLKHTAPSMTHLTSALERLGAVEDCMHLVKLSEVSRPGDHTAHRAALRVAGRIRDVHTAGQASKLAAQLAEADSLSKEDYLAVINSQFWLKQDHEQLLQTVAAMKAAGHELNEQVLQQLLHVYCHNGMWGEALQVLDDVAAGRFSSSKQPGQQHHPSKGGRRHGDTAAAGVGDHTTIDNDKLWHVVMRKLWERRASDALLNDFLQHMAPAQLQRFKLLYGLQLIPGQQQYTLKPVEDWHLPLQAPTSASSSSTSSTSSSTSSSM